MPYKDPEKRRLSRRGEFQRKYRRRITIINELKSSPCTDCGGLFPPECMDFDHVKGKKVRGVACLMNAGWGKVIEEIEKCELVCANCHRIRTKRRRYGS